MKLPIKTWESFLKDPNYLTMYRIAAAPLLMLLLSFPNRIVLFLSALVFTIASITDFLDGYYARKNGMVSNFGKIMDPIADKFLMSTVFIMLSANGFIPAWMVCVIIGRELAVTGMRVVLIDKGADVSASKLGKYKTGFQIAASIPLILHYSYFGIDMHAVGTVLIWAALIFTLWSGWDYYVNYKNLNRQSRTSSLN